MDKHYEVIIIGAGPSGLATALNLLKNGIKDTNVVPVISQIKPKKNMNL